MAWSGRSGVRAGRQLGPVSYLGAVLSHGVVVEAGLGLELLPAVLALERILQLLANFHMLLEPHEGLSGDNTAGGADSLAPFMDGPLPLLLRTTWGRVGHRGRHLLADGAGGGLHLLPDVLRARALLLLGAVAAGFVFSLGQAFESEGS